MMQKKSGFTLVEILVVIAISAIVLTMVGTTMVFMTNVSGNLLEEAEDIDMAKNIEKYLRNIMQDNTKTIDKKSYIIDNSEMSFGAFEIQNNNIVENEKIIFSDTGLVVFNITEKNVDKEEGNDFIVCYMKFKSGKEFEFILGPVN